MPTPPGSSSTTAEFSAFDEWCMQQALDLALQGQGFVEPNPMVGCVIAKANQIVGKGWHGRFGGPHAEVEALRQAGTQAAGATAYVTLEPCCHHGKTPPCAAALIEARIQRVVIGVVDPFPKVDGGGVRHLQEAGLEVQVGLRSEQAKRLIAPFTKLIRLGRPWVHAKWAMTLDGKIATSSGNSQWISNAKSRRIVHDLRGRCDAIAVGIGTVLADDPLLTARPPGPREPTRIVLDSAGRTPPDSQLVRTANETAVLIVVTDRADSAARGRLTDAGCEVWECPGNDRVQQWRNLLDELGRRQMTNILVEGGRHVLGALFDASEINECHVFMAPKLVGGLHALSPLGGAGANTIEAGIQMKNVAVECLDDDVYVRAVC